MDSHTQLTEAHDFAASSATNANWNRGQSGPVVPRRSSRRNWPSFLPQPSTLNPQPFLARLHRDQRGAIAPLSVFAIFLFTILMVQVVNVGRQIDDKLRMQNAADASGYSGATVLARGMNAIAFSNHMLCETFALTAYMREGRDRKSEKFVPEILDAWAAVGNQFASGTGTAPLSQKFKLMGQAIVAKVPVEREMVRNFGEMTFHQARITLPLFEYILAGPTATTYEGRTDESLGGFIPRFQRAVLQSVPHMSSVASDEISIRYGTRVQSQHRNQQLRGLLWATNVSVVGWLDESNPVSRTLPVIDPSRHANDLSQVDNTLVADCNTCFSCYECISRTQRQQLASHYLNDWIRHWMSPYFEYPDDGTRDYGATSAKMSNFINLWRVFTCANLQQLLDEEYPFTNLPFILRDPPTFPDGCVRTPDHPDRPCNPPRPLDHQTLEKNFNFVSSVYWPHQQPMFPGLFKNPLERDSHAYATAFAQTTIFLPRGQFTRHHPLENAPWVHQYPCPPNGTCCSNLYNGYPGDWNRHTLSNTDPGRLLACPDDPQARQPYNCSLPWFAYDARWERFGQWDMFNQNWTAKLVPATAANVPTIVSQHPANYLNGALQNYQPPPLKNVSQQDFHLVNGH